MPIYIKTDSDEALLEAMKLSEERENILSVSTFPLEDNRAISLEQCEVKNDNENVSALPWEYDSQQSSSVSCTACHDLQQMGNLITDVKEPDFSPKVIYAMMKIISLSSFMTLGHTKD